MDLRNYLSILRRSWVLVVGFISLGLLLGGAVSVTAEPTYTAETQLFVAIQGSGSIQELQQGNTFGQSRVQSYVKTVNSPLVLQPAIDALGLRTTAEELAGRVTATTDMNTVLINIAVADSSAVGAAALAQAVGSSLIDAIEKLETPKAGGASPVSLSVTKPATAPDNPSGPNTRMNLLIGLLGGNILGFGAAALKAALDNRIRIESDLRRATDAPILGSIAYDDDVTRNPLLTQTAPQSPRAESYRQLRTNLQFANVSGHAKTILVTSSLPGEGKTTTATNIAIAMAQSGYRICLIDADLRRPMVGEYLGIDKTAGLTTILVGDAVEHDVLQAWGGDDLYVLASGRIPPNPSELLGSDAMRQLIERLEQSFDTIIIDAPPLLPVTDAAVLSQHVGGVVVVAGSQKLKVHDLQKSLTTLKMVNAAVLGIVLNRRPVKGADAYAYGYYNHSSDDASQSSVGDTTLRNNLRDPMGSDIENVSNLIAGGSTRRRAASFPRHQP